MNTETTLDDFSPHDAGGPNQQSPIAVIRTQAERMGQQFHAALPAHIPVERFTRVVLTAIQNNPELVAADRQSLWNAAMRAAQDGLLPDGREGAIVVYNTKVRSAGKDHWIKKAQWMPMVFGILKKVRNSGEIATITARVVYGGDKFRYWIDDDGEHVLYEPSDNPNTDVVVRVFAMAKTKGGEIYVEPMTSADVEKVRAASRAKDGSPWVNWWEEMAKKTAIRRLSKRLPMSTDLDDLVRRDDDLYNFDRGDEQITTDQKKVTQARQTLESFAGQIKQIELHDPETGEVKEQSIATSPTPPGGEDNPVRDAEPPVTGLSSEEPCTEGRTGGATPPTGAQEARKQQRPAKAAHAEGEYVAHATAWINALTDPAGGKARWNDEKALRSRLNVEPDVRDKLLDALKEKIASLTDQDESGLLAEDDKALAAAAKSGSRALEEAIAAIPESRRATHEMAIARRHRHAAAEADAAARAGVEGGER